MAKTPKVMSFIKRGFPILLLGGLLGLSACAELELASHAAKQMQDDEAPTKDGAYKVGKPYQIAGVWYYPVVDYGYSETGIASWYGPGFNGRSTANGEIYDDQKLTAAHRTLPLPSMARVTNLENGRSIVVRINDRGPFKSGRIIDLSRRGAQLLDFERAGTAKVRVEILEEESRRLAALIQSRDDRENAPLPAPVVPVAEAPLVAGEGGDVIGAQTVAQAAVLTPEETSGGDVFASSTEVESVEPIYGGGVEAEALPIPQSESQGAQTAALPSEALATSAPQTELSPTWHLAPVPEPDGKVYQTSVEETAIFVQAGAFVEKRNADRLHKKIAVLGKPTSVSPRLIGDRLFYRVRLGPVESIDEADQLLHVLLSNGIEGAKVIVD